MESYCQYNDAFYNSDNENLDQLARKINDDKKKLPQKVQESIKMQEENARIGINCLLDPSNARYAPSNLADYGFFSTQGDFSSQLPTPIAKHKKGKKRKKKEKKMLQHTFRCESERIFSYKNITFKISKSLFPHTKCIKKVFFPQKKKRN